MSTLIQATGTSDVGPLLSVLAGNAAVRRPACSPRNAVPVSHTARKFPIGFGIKLTNN